MLLWVSAPQAEQGSLLSVATYLSVPKIGNWKQNIKGAEDGVDRTGSVGQVQGAYHRINPKHPRKLGMNNFISLILL